MISTRFKPSSLLFLATACGLLALLLTFAEPRERILLRNTLLLASAVLGIALPLGTAIGIAAARTDLPARQFLALWFAVSLLTPLHLLAAAWQMGLGLQSWLAYLGEPGFTAWFNGWPAAITVHSAAALPWVAWLVASAARRTERGVEELALLEAPPRTVIRRVLLPQLYPALAIAALLVFSQVTTEIAVTDFFRIRTWAEEVYVSIAVGGWDAIQGTQPLGIGERVADLDEVARTWWSASQLALAGCLTLLWCGLLWLAGSTLRRAALNPTQPPLRYSWGRWRGAAGAVWLLIVAVGVGFPLSNMMIKAGWVVTRLEGNVYERSWSMAKVVQMTLGSITRYRMELLTSFQAAAVAATIGLVLIVALQWLLRQQPWWLNPGLWLAVVMLVVPGPVLGLWLISVFNHPALTWLHPLYDRSLVVIELAQMLRVWPWIWSVVAVTFSTIGRGQLEQAELEGASAWHIVRRILWPQLWPSWLLAWLLGFELALGELAATILVTPPGITPLSVRLFTLLHSDYEAEVAGLCLLLIGLHAAEVGAISWLLSKNSRDRY
jgi:iron(III) transport system permease protein